MRGTEEDNALASSVYIRILKMRHSHCLAVFRHCYNTEKSAHLLEDDSSETVAYIDDRTLFGLGIYVSHEFQVM